MVQNWYKSTIILPVKFRKPAEIQHFICQCFSLAGNTKYAETEVLLWLIIWSMSEWQQFLAECFPAGKKGTVNCPVYEKCKIFFADKRNSKSAMGTVY